MNYNNIFSNALLSSQENDGNPRRWSRGRTMGRERGEIGDEERQGRAGGSTLLAGIIYKVPSGHQALA